MVIGWGARFCGCAVPVKPKAACWPAARKSNVWSMSAKSAKPPWQPLKSSCKACASSNWCQEDSREQVRRRLQDEARQQGEIKAKLSASKAKVEQLTLRRRRLDEELAELAEQRALEHEQVGEARLQLQEALDAMATDTEQRELLLAQRDSLRERLDRVRQDARQHKDHAHQLAVRLGSLKAQHDSTRQALERLELQSERLAEKREQLNAQPGGGRGASGRAAPEARRVAR
jgi:chromosome segregation protein